MKFLDVDNLIVNNLINIIKLIVLTVIISLLFAELYDKLNFFLSPLWLSAAIANSGIAVILIILTLLAKQSLNIPKRKLFNVEIINHERFPIILAGIVVLLSISLSTISSFFGTPIRYEVKYTYFLFVIWIPIIEEVVFRYGIGSFLRKFGGLLWGSYFSALTFSLIHSGPTISNILQLKIAFPLGPLLLGLICEFLYINYGSLVYLIIFHACCNLSVIIFTYIDARWLSWLGFLYS